jgi:DNA-binding XRE family transcriptional regulator
MTKNLIIGLLVRGERVGPMTKHGRYQGGNSSASTWPDVLPHDVPARAPIARNARSARETLARNMRLLRTSRRLSQSALADEAGVIQATISVIESGKANPPLASLERIARVLGVGMDALFAHEARKERA